MEFTGRKSPPRNINMRFGDSLKAYCHMLVEEHEEDIKGLVMKGDAFQPKNIGTRAKRWLCYRKAETCSVQQLDSARASVLPKGFNEPDPPPTNKESVNLEAPPRTWWQRARQGVQSYRGYLLYLAVFIVIVVIVWSP